MHKKYFNSIALITIIFSLLLSFFVCPVKAEEERTVKVGYTIFENYQEGEEGEYKSGFGYEYLQRISYYTGWKYEYVYGSFPELLEKLENGEIDIMGDITYTAQRAKVMDFSALPQGKENYYIFCKPDNSDIDPNVPATLSNKKISVTKGSYQENLLKDWAWANDYYIDIVSYASSSEAAEALKNDEVDAMVMPNLASNGLYLPVVSIGAADFYFAVSKYSPEVLKELNDAMRHIQTIDPYYNEATYSKYVTSPLSVPYLGKQEKLYLEERNYTVTLGYLDDNMPYCDDNNGKLAGLFTIIVDKFKDTFNIDVKTVSYSNYEDMLNDAYKGKIDIFGPLYSDYYLAEQGGFMNSDSIASTSLILLYKGDYSDELVDSIAVSRKSAIQLAASFALYPQSDMVFVEDKLSCLDKVKNGEAESTIITSSSLNRLIKTDEFSGLEMYQLSRTADICLGTYRNNTHLLDIINRVIFASKDELNSSSLMSVEYIETPYTISDFIENNAMIVVIVLICICLLMFFGFAYVLKMNNNLMSMQNKNEELSSAAFRDGLTKVGNRALFLDKEQEIQQLMCIREPIEFAIVVCDVNGLKQTNDNFGHELGDVLIQNAARTICEIYKHSPVYRIGGDEFVVIVQNEDYADRDFLLSRLKNKIELKVNRSQIENGLVSIAYGMAVYDRNKDLSFQEIFKRADHAMYDCKKKMKDGDRI